MGIVRFSTNKVTGENPAHYLEEILVIPCCHPLQLGCVGGKPPNGIPPKCRHKTKSGKMFRVAYRLSQKALPAVKFAKSSFIHCLKDTKKVHKQSFPTPQFDFMHEVDDEHHKKIETELR
jgi:hypothetical protein